MAIAIKREPSGWDELLESCCFCRTPTPYWTALELRGPGEQVACCPKCAWFQWSSDVPSKGDWCDAQCCSDCGDLATYFCSDCDDGMCSSHVRGFRVGEPLCRDCI